MRRCSGPAQHWKRHDVLMKIRDRNIGTAIALQRTCDPGVSISRIRPRTWPSVRERDGNTIAHTAPVSGLVLIFQICITLMICATANLSQKSWSVELQICCNSHGWHDCSVCSHLSSWIDKSVHTGVQIEKPVRAPVLECPDLPTICGGCWYASIQI